MLQEGATDRESFSSQKKSSSHLAYMHSKLVFSSLFRVVLSKLKLAVLLRRLLGRTLDKKKNFMTSE